MPDFGFNEEITYSSPDDKKGWALIANELII